MKSSKNSIPNVIQVCPLTDAGWKAIFDISTWQQIRMNLATFNRHNVFNDFSYVNKAYERLTSREDILRSKVMPYSVFSAYLNSGDIPARIKESIEYCCTN